MKLFRLLLSSLLIQTSFAAKPNIVLIVSDDMGYSDTGAHGCKDIPTPHLDSIAANGVRCTAAYVTAAQCSPSRAGLLTGRYQQRFGHEFNPNEDQGELHPNEKTMGAHLQSLGYKTALVGKWHLGRNPENQPTQRGFDEFYGLLSNTNSYTKPMLRDSMNRSDKRQPLPDDYYLTTVCGERAADFVHRHHDQPFFLYLAFNAVHTPLEAPQIFLDRVPDISDPQRRKNAAMAVALDDAVGQVIAAVRKHDLEQNTLIIFINDNGSPNNNGGSNLPLRGFKGQTWEGGIRTAMFIQWKDRLPAGSVFGQPVISLDILPTALAAAQNDPPSPSDETLPALDGVNLLPYLTGEYSGLPHEALYWRAGDQMAVRMGPWKLTRAVGIRGVQKLAARGCEDLDSAQLFNLNTDPSEQDDLSDAHPEQKQRLITAWRAWSATLQPPAWEPRQD